MRQSVAGSVADAGLAGALGGDLRALLHHLHRAVLQRAVKGAVRAAVDVGAAFIALSSQSTKR